MAIGVISLLIAVGALYTYLQYKQGLSKSIVEKEKDTEIVEEEYEFNGEKDQFGNTNILLIGTDARGEERSRADTIMIAHFHEDTGTYKLTSIMRDIYVEIPGHNSNKINVALALGGPELLRKTIKENFDISLQYYSIVDFQGFERLIDEAFPQGVEVNVEKHMSENIGVTLKPGRQRLDGKHLLGYVRFRQDAVGDFGRVERQQEVIKSVANQLASVETIPKLPRLVGSITPFVNTNLKTTEMLFMGRTVLMGDQGEIETLRIPVEGSYQHKRISGAGAVLSLDFDKNKQALRDFFSST